MLGKDFTPLAVKPLSVPTPFTQVYPIFTSYLIKALSLHFVIMVCSQNYGESA